MPRRPARESALRRRIWSPPAHWRLLAFCLIVVVLVVLFQGFSTHTIGASTEADAALAVPPRWRVAGRSWLLAASGYARPSRRLAGGSL